MKSALVPTAPTDADQSGQHILEQYQRCPDRPDRPDPKVERLAEKHVSLSVLADRWRGMTDHDAAEATAMAEHYAAPAGPLPPARDPLADGLLRGFHAHRAALAQTSTPLPGARPPSRPGHPHHGE